MLAAIHGFAIDESGATAIEYGLIAALLSVAAMLALAALGTELQAVFNATRSAMSSSR